MPSSFLQTPAWAEFKHRQGWDSTQVDGVSVLGRRLPFGQRFLYAPEMPLPPIGLPVLLTELSNLARTQGAFVVRLEFFEEWSLEAHQFLAGLGLRKAFEELQPEFRQWIDLRPSPTVMLAKMKPKGRYNIKVAERAGVVVDHAHEPTDFIRLYEETARRDRFRGRSAGYFHSLAELIDQYQVGNIWLARIDKTPLAAAITLHWDGMTSYLYGASSSQARAAMAPYALHWAIMQDAHDRGDELYDLLAIAPFGHPDYELREANFRLARKFGGITRFKQQFGGRSVHLLGSWDLVINPLVYAVFAAAQGLRRG